MTTYHVATSGVNKIPGGTAASPWKTINYAVDKLSPGDILSIHAGTYVEIVNVDKGGTKDKWITIQNHNDDVVTIDGETEYHPSTNTTTGLPNTSNNEVACQNTPPCNGPDPGRCMNYGGLLNIRASYIRADGINVTRSRGRGVRIYTKTTNRIHDIIFENATVDYSNAQNLLVVGSNPTTGSHDVIIRNCKFSNSGFYYPEGRSASQVCDWVTSVGITSNAYNILVEDCDIIENWGEGIIFDTGDDWSHDITVRGCRIQSAISNSLAVHAAYNVIIENNFVSLSPDTEARGFSRTRLSGVAPAEDNFEIQRNVENVLIRNNIFANGTTGFRIAGGPNRQGGTRNIRFVHNTVINCDLRNILASASKPEDILIENNVFWNADPTWDTSNDDVPDIWVNNSISRNNLWSKLPDSKLRSNADLNTSEDILVDPTFFPNAIDDIDIGDPSTLAGFAPLDNSPIIGAGRYNDEVAVDFYGNVRDSNPTIGAIEAAGGTAPPQAEAVIAKFSSSPQTGSAPLTVSFNGTASEVTSGSIVSYTWDFGDGASGSTAVMQHTYATAGQYTVKLTVAGATGVTDTKTRANNIVVNSPITNPCLKTRTYTNPGTYTVNLTVTGESGVSDTIDHHIVVTAADMVEDFHVAKTGSDSNDGSYDSPWLTINYAIQWLRPGSVLHIHAGVYEEVVLVNCSGNSGARIEIVNYENDAVEIFGGARVEAGETLGLPDGSGIRRNDIDSSAINYLGWGNYDGLVDITGSHIILSGIKISNSRGRGIRIFTNESLVQDITLQSLVIERAWMGGILVSDVLNVLVKECVIKESSYFWPASRTAVGTLYKPQPALSITPGSNSIKVESCKIINNYGSGLVAYSKEEKATNITVLTTKIMNGLGEPLTLHGCDDVLVDGCILGNAIDQGSLGFDFVNATNIAPRIPAPKLSSERLLIRNNVIINSPYGLGLFGYADDLNLRDVQILHNTVVNCTKANLAALAAKITLGVVQNNVFWNSNSAANVTPGQEGSEHDMPDAWGDNVVWKNNAWSKSPKPLAVGDGDVISAANILTNGNYNTQAEADFITANFAPIEDGVLIFAGEFHGNAPTDIFGRTRNSPPSIGAIEGGGPGNDPEIIHATLLAVPTSGDRTLTVAFDGEADSSVENGSIDSYHIDFGDGNESNFGIVNHNYVEVGIYTAVLTVTGSTGVSDTHSLEITVTEPALPPGPGLPITATIRVNSNVIAGTETIVEEELNEVYNPRIALSAGLRGADDVLEDGGELSIGISQDSQGSTQYAVFHSAEDNNNTDYHTSFRQSSGFSLGIPTRTSRVDSQYAITGMNKDYIRGSNTIDERFPYTQALFSGESLETEVHNVQVASTAVTTTLSFVPDLVLVMMAPTSLINQNYQNMILSLGAMTSGAQAVASISHRSNQSATRIYGYVGDDYLVSNHKAGGSFLSGSISGNDVILTPLGGDWVGEVVFTAIKLGGNDVSVSLIDLPHSTSAVTYTLGSRPQFAMLFYTDQDVEGEANNSMSQMGVYMHGYHDTVENSHSYSTFIKPGAATSDTKRVSHPGGLRLYSTSGVEQLQLTGSFVPTGFKLTPVGTPTIGTARKGVLILVEESDQQASSVPVPQVQIAPDNPTYEDTIRVINLVSPGTYDFAIDWGDGSAISTGANEYTHVYSDNGYYTITSSLSDGTTTTSVEDDLLVTIPQPIADFLIQPTTGVVPFSTTLDASLSIPGGHEALVYNWKIVLESNIPASATTIPDGTHDVTELVGETVVYNVLAASPFVVELTARNSSEPEFFYDKKFKRNAIYPVLEEPVAIMFVDRNCGVAPLTIIATAEDDLKGLELQEAYWIVSDEVFSGNEQKSFTFELPGEYVIQRHVVTSGGESWAAENIVVLSAESPAIGYAIPGTSDKFTGNVISRIQDDSCAEEHTHKIDNSDSGEPSKIVSLDISGETGFGGIGVGAPKPAQAGYDNPVSINAKGWINIVPKNNSGGLEAEDGDLEIFAGETLFLNSGAKQILPRESGISLGSAQDKWLTAYIEELVVSVLVAQKKIATIGGSVLIATTDVLLFNLEIDQTWIITKEFIGKQDDVLYLKSEFGLEYLRVSSFYSFNAETGNHTTGVLRDRSDTGKYLWPEGTAVVNISDGVVDLYAKDGLGDLQGEYPGKGPSIVFREPIMRAWGPDWEMNVMSALGELKGMYGKAVKTIGAAFGLDSEDSSYLIAEATGLYFHGKDREKLIEFTPDNGLDFLLTTFDSWARGIGWVESIDGTTARKKSASINANRDSVSGILNLSISATRDDASNSIEIQAGTQSINRNSTILLMAETTSAPSAQLSIQTADGTIGEEALIQISADQVIFARGLPTSDPAIAGALWRSGTDVKISLG